MPNKKVNKIKNTKSKKRKFSTPKQIKKSIIKKKPAVDKKKSDMLNYGADTITSLDKWYEQYRGRPDIFVGGESGNDILKHVFNEVITNSIDEHNMGFKGPIYVNINTRNNKKPIITVKDSGRGIPLEALEKSVSKPFSSGKYIDLNGVGGYDGASAGKNGVGLKFTNACSEYFEVTTKRDGFYETQIWSKGILKSKKNGKTKKPNGVDVTFIPDTTVSCYKDLNIKNSNKKEYFTYLEVASYVNESLDIRFTWNNDKEIRIYNPGGVNRYFNNMVKENKIRLIGEPNYIKKSVIDPISKDRVLSYDIMYGFCDNSKAKIVSYANGIHTKDGGVHVKSLTESFAVLTSTLNKGEFLPKSIANKVSISGKEVRESLVAVVMSTVIHPNFSTQMKSELMNVEYKSRAIPYIRKQILEWINSNNTTINKIGNHLALLTKIRYENSKNREKSLKAGLSKSDISKMIDITKYTPCNKNDPSKSELFITEGLSASGPIKSVRDRDYQAVYSLRGKLINTIKGEINDELSMLVTVMGCDIGEKKNLKKLNFSKIILLADSDDDGHHIVALLIAFFFKYYPELIRDGKLYVGNPPLYVMRSKKYGSLYMKDENHKNAIIVERGIQAFNCITSKNKILPEEVSKYYFSKVLKFYEMVHGYAKRFAVTEHPLILEAIAVDFRNVMNCKFDVFKKYGFKVSGYRKIPNGLKLTISVGYKSYFLEINKDMYLNVIKPMIKFITRDIRLCRIRLVSKKDKKKIYTREYYTAGRMIHDLIFKESSMEMHREKGLGSADAKELKETSIDPKSRMLTKLTMFNEAEARRVLTSLFTNSPEKERMFSEGWEFGKRL